MHLDTVATANNANTVTRKEQHGGIFLIELLLFFIMSFLSKHRRYK
jgi:hypothetical protein